ncbi:MAG: DUF2961 domain-containing protein [Phycisphaerae bacterium]|nr:DUF2961 domain-containing protein [Phycisphaerae bacterium]
MKRLTLLTLVTIAMTHLAGCVAAPVRTGQLLREMTDMTRLTDEPSPAYKTVQFSSYDRRSNLPGGPGWFANSDGFGREPIPGFQAVVKEPDADGVGEYLICDVKGPGAIVRTWTAAMNGTIRVFLDGRRKPLYEGPTADFLFSPYHAIAKASGDEASMPDGVFQQHQAGYCPIPFAKRCRITWTGQLEKVHFYQIQIRQYEPGTPVRSFQPADLKTFAEAAEDARRILGAPASEYVFASREAPVEIAAVVNPQEQVEVLKLDGPKALERLTLKLDADDRDRALRQTVLRIFFDESPWAQVQAPVGDFFGAAPGVNPFDSIPFTVEPDGTMTCRYVMPFESSARIVLDNRGDQLVTATGSVLPMDYHWCDRSMHFRARWRVDHGVLGWGRRPQDMPFLLAGGSGRYVGSALMLLNPCRASTPWGGWWGEGDEKVFVDDDRVPSIFGTGSEDYFNYAWSAPDIFSDAYCGQPRNDGPGNRGFVTNHRWHILDDLPFRERFAFYLELYPHDRVPDMSYARIGYYYARPGCYDDHVEITDEDLRPLELPPDWQPAAAYVLQDAEIHAVEDLVQPGPRTTMIEGRLWAGGEMLAWHPAAEGEMLDLPFSVAKQGKYQLHLGLALTPEAGRISAKIDGDPAHFARRDDVLNLHVPYRVLARQFSTEDVSLTEGEHTLTIVFEDAPDSVESPVIGLDYLAVRLVPEKSEQGAK